MQKMHDNANVAILIFKEKNFESVTYLKKQYLLHTHQSCHSVALVQKYISLCKPQSAESASDSSEAFQYPTITLQQSLIPLHDGGNYDFVASCCALSSL